MSQVSVEIICKGLFRAGLFSLFLRDISSNLFRNGLKCFANVKLRSQKHDSEKISVSLLCVCLDRNYECIHIRIHHVFSSIFKPLLCRLHCNYFCLWLQDQPLESPFLFVIQGPVLQRLSARYVASEQHILQLLPKGDRQWGGVLLRNRQQRRSFCRVQRRGSFNYQHQHNHHNMESKYHDDNIIETNQHLNFET